MYIIHAYNVYYNNNNNGKYPVCVCVCVVYHDLVNSSVCVCVCVSSPFRRVCRVFAILIDRRSSDLCRMEFKRLRAHTVCEIPHVIIGNREKENVKSKINGCDI